MSQVGCLPILGNVTAPHRGGYVSRPLHGGYTVVAAVHPLLTGRASNRSHPARAQPGLAPLADLADRSGQVPESLGVCRQSTKDEQNRRGLGAPEIGERAHRQRSGERLAHNRASHRRGHSVAMG